MNLIGLDLGKTQDPSALCVFTRRDVVSAPLPKLPPKPEKHGPPLPPKVDWDAAAILDPRREAERRYQELSKPFITGEAAFDQPVLDQAPGVKTERRYLCRMLKKWTLGTSYVQVVRDVRNLCAQPRMQVEVEGKIHKPTLIVDATGLGAPVTDMLRAAGVPAQMIAVTITGGNKIVQQTGPESFHWHVPKHFLVNTLQVLMQSGRIDWPPNMRDPATGEDMQEALMQELRDFRVHEAKTAKSNESFEAEEGSHDDLLMACTYAVWWGERGGRTPKIW